MYPTIKTKRKGKAAEVIRKLTFSEDVSEEEIAGGYDPEIRRMLARAEKRGDKIGGKRQEESSNESENGDSSDDSKCEGATFTGTLRSRQGSTARRERQCICEGEEDRQQTLRAIEKTIDERFAASSVSWGALNEQIERLQLQRRELREREGQKSYSLRSRKDDKTDRMLPVLIWGQNLEYKPRQNTDMSDILEKLPTIQDGAHPWRKLWPLRASKVE